MPNTKMKNALIAACIAAGLAAGSRAAVAQTPLTATTLRTALASPPPGDALASEIRSAFGGDAKLQKGASPKADNTPEGITIAWAIEAQGATSAPTVETGDPGLASVPLQRVGTSDIYAGTVVAPKGLAGNWSYVVNGQKVGGGRYEDYPVSLDEKPNPAVPKGKVTEMPVWKSTILAGTSRQWWVYVPAQYTPDKPVGYIVCQDGGGPKNWLPTVLDNLIAKGDIPPVVAIFINPGTFEGGKSNRSVEYDTLSDTYSQMLLQEILPEVEKTIKLNANPDEHMIYGVSSGGICAFTVAWNHPDVFHKVDTCVGSFTALQGGPSGVAGGNTYPAIIRKSAGMKQEVKPKPIKMFQTDGANDLDNPFGNWPLANQEIAKALDFAGYEHRFVYSNGFHGERFGRYMMPEALRYLLGNGK